MNEEFKAKWVAALRSGEFTQTDGRLKRGDSYCCLGVACELYRRENPGASWGVDGYFRPSKDREGVDYGSGLVLPRPVRSAIGLELGDPLPLPRLPIQDEWDDWDYLSALSLSGLNDSGFTFDQIADIIEYFA